MASSVIEEVCKALKSNWKVSGGMLAAGLACAVIWRRRRSKQHKKTYPPDTVVVYQIERGPSAPSLIPFVVKLETFLRMAKIPYLTDHSMTFGSKGKFPWIQYQGKTVSDSEFCIQFLNETLSIDLNRHLTIKENAIGRAFQKLVEDSIYWTFVMDRFIYDETEEAYVLWKVPKILRRFPRSSLRNGAVAQGIGRHTKEEVLGIFRKDLIALSDFIGDNKYLFGDVPCQYDCAIFGLLSQFRYQALGGYQGKIFQEFPNLMRYCDDIRRTFWPDWDECTTRGGTVEATK